VFRRSLAKNTGPYRDRGASVALQGVSGSTATVFIRWPYSLHTFDRVLRIAQINTTFTTGHSLRSAYLRTAGALLPGTMPACCLQPSNMLGAIPPLPENIRGRQETSGHAIWNVPCPSFARGTWRMIAKMNLGIRSTSPMP
jgi:hypothetical protein